MTQMNMINADNSIKILFDLNYLRHQRSIFIKNRVYFSKPIKSQTLCEKVESLCSGTGGPFG